MQVDSTAFHWWIGVGVTVGLAGLGGLMSYVGMMIRNDVKDNRIETQKDVAGVIEKLDKNKSEIRGDIAEVAKKAEQVKQELSEKQDELKDNFNQKHLENSNVIVGHITKDEERDKADSRTFLRIDDNINEMRKELNEMRRRPV